MIKVKTSNGLTRAAGKRVLESAAKDAVVDTVRYWHEKFMPGHFTLEAKTKYGYQPRKGDDEPPQIMIRGKLRSNPHYSWRKRREQRHNLPLVWSGASLRMARQQVRLSSRVARADETITGTAAMELPSYFYKYRRDQSQPDKYAELIETTESEELELADAYSHAFEKYFTVRQRGESAVITQTRA